MTQDKALLKQALDALTFAYNACDSEWVMDEKINPSIAALQAAIDVPESKVTPYITKTQFDRAFPETTPAPAQPLSDGQIWKLMRENDPTVYEAFKLCEQAHGITEVKS